MTLNIIIKCFGLLFVCREWKFADNEKWKKTDYTKYLLLDSDG